MQTIVTNAVGVPAELAAPDGRVVRTEGTDPVAAAPRCPRRPNRQA
ncbi:hypothetical protein [Kitasatospora sp. MBT63]|nr:hypothetical protein [Kitasatospora sp. MBT63]